MEVQEEFAAPGQGSRAENHEKRERRENCIKMISGYYNEPIIVKVIRQMYMHN